MGNPMEEGLLPKRDRRYLPAGIVASLLIHLALGVAFASVGDKPVTVAGSIRRGQLLCPGGLRCPAVSWPRPRLPLEAALAPDVDMIQAAVIPRLGMLEQEPKKLPELQKYEQPEKVEEGVNIQQDNPPPQQPPPPKEFEHKEAQIDKRSQRPRSLDAILGAPDDDDKRRRATDLAHIIGNPNGSTTGVGTQFVAGNEWAGEVQVALQKEFRVPTSIDDSTLKGLVVEITIKKLSANGEIELFQMTKQSASPAYNTAAVQVIKRFMPAEGGPLALPKPEAKVLEFVNRYGLLVQLEGRLFHR